MNYPALTKESVVKLKHGNFVMLPKYISKYSERALPQHNWAIKTMEKDNFVGMSKILDLGCRDGFTSMELAKRNLGAHIIGLDNSIQLLELANENLARQPIQNLEFSFLDAMAFYTPESFDAVFSSSYMHWVQDKLNLLRAINKVLKPGGKVFFLFFADHQKKRFDNCVSAVANREQWSKYFKNYRPAIKEITAYQFAGYVNKSGLILEKLEFIEIHDIFISKLQFMDWMTTWCDYLKYLPEELHYVFLSEVTDKHLETHPPDSKGQIHRFDTMLEVNLTKEPFNA
jgi:trans-aconitate 2-methyltransferase